MTIVIGQELPENICTILLPKKDKNFRGMGWRFCMELNWNFQRSVEKGGGGLRKNPFHGRGMDISRTNNSTSTFFPTNSFKLPRPE